MTVEYPVLARAPITEAVLDIRIKPQAEINTAALSSLHQHVSDNYPIKQERFQFESRVDFKKDEAQVSASKGTLTGYFFKSGDHKQIFQARTDGFTFNRLQPYEKWELFRDEARRLWTLYSTLASPEIVRVALRYINKLDIPLSLPAPIDFDEYLAAGPVVPPELPQGVSSFLTRLVIPNPEIEATAVISQAFEQIDPKFLPIILDIDVFRQKDLISKDEIWQTFENLRLFKNRIFFASLTNKALELFK